MLHANKIRSDIMLVYKTVSMVPNAFNLLASISNVLVRDFISVII